MARGEAYLVVGHSNWGKSRTLRALTEGSLARRVSLPGQTLFIRRMSNDDEPAEFHKRVRAFKPPHKRHLVIALCPKIDDADTTVLGVAYDGSVMDQRHIQPLRQLGIVSVLDKKAEPEERAAALRVVIERHLLRPTAR